MSAALLLCTVRRGRLTPGHKRDRPTPAPTAQASGGGAGQEGQKLITGEEVLKPKRP